MECTNCGFSLSQLDKECPRCVYLAKTQQFSQPTQAMPPQPASLTLHMKPCPQCGNRLVQSARQCPLCKFDYPDPATILSGSAFCTSCGQAIGASVRFCPDCGNPRQSSGSAVPMPIINVQVHLPPMTTIPYQPVSEAYSSPKTLGIAMMWGLTIAQILVALTMGASGFALAFVLDIPAFILAIMLVCSKNDTDKANGWAKLSLEIVGFAVAFFVSAFRR